MGVARMRKINKNRPGLTLIELILSIAIIGMIIVSFMPLFVMSAKNNSKADNTLDATYLGKDAMELAYHLSSDETVDYNNLALAGYTYLGHLSVEPDISDPTKGSSYAYGKEVSDNKYIYIKFSKANEDEDLVAVLVKVYKSPAMVENELEAQYETLYIWEEV